MTGLVLRLRFVYLHGVIAHARARRAIPRPVRGAWRTGQLLFTPCLVAGLFLAAAT